MFLSLLFSAAYSRRPDQTKDKYTRDNDPVHYMRELEFRNTIDQYDLAIVMFFKKDVDECKRILPGFRYAAHKARGRADFISISAKTAPDLVDELGVDTFPTFFSFRNGHLIEKLKNTSSNQELYWYVRNVTAARYRYIQSPKEVSSTLKEANTTMVVGLPLIDARMDKLLAVVTTRFYNTTQVVVAQTPEIANAFGIDKFPSFTIIRSHDDKMISFPGEPQKATVKSLSDFVENNYRSAYQLIANLSELNDEPTEPFFLAVMDLYNPEEVKLTREILDKVAAENPNQFRIRYADKTVTYNDIFFNHLENYTTPFFGFFKNSTYQWHKWIYDGKLTPLAVAAFCADYQRGRGVETIVSTQIAEKSPSPLKYFTGAELKAALDRRSEKDFVINFVGYPCPNCAEVDELFHETVTWAKQNGIRHVVFGRVNASCNDIPVTVWRNETYPYGWMFPAKNRTGAFPIGKRRQLYWMAQLLVDNSTQPIKAEMPRKPDPTPLPPKRET